MPEIDPTFYRSPTAAVAAPPEQLAYVVAFHPTGQAKDALAANSRGVPFLTVRGRIGGSAMTAAAVNALARPGL